MRAVMARTPGATAAAALYIAFWALGCSQHVAPRFGFEDVLLVRIVPSTEDVERGSFDVAIQITNHTKNTAHFGHKRVYPWLEALHMDDPDLARGISKGHGQALSPFVVEPGSSVVLNRTIRLDNTPLGKYLIRFDAALGECQTPALLIVPAIVRLQESRQREGRQR